MTGLTADKQARRRKLVTILSQIPFRAWEEIVRNEPEWVHMEPLLERYGYGPFAVLLIATGLNDYQLKGKAEHVYWPRIRRLLNGAQTIRTPSELESVLTPFYAKERLGAQKLDRLGRFCRSHLASKLWQSRPRVVADHFSSVWRKLARIMNQTPEKKTICFAMKCLGIALLMAGEYRFDFMAIPIPVDFRVRKFMERAGLVQPNQKEEEIRAFWNEMLLFIKKSCPQLTMIHLDSLIWQIARLEKIELEKYFKGLGLPLVGKSILQLMRTK